MEKRMVTVTERAMTTTVNDIEHMESQSYNGVAIIKVFFQPNVKPEMALAQISSICQTLLRVLPPGTTPPFLLKYDASSVPMLQLGLSGQGLSEQQLYDLGLNFVRTQLGDGARGFHPAALWRQAAPDHGRSRPQPVVRAPSLTAGHFRRAESAEPDSAHRHSEDRQPRVPGRDEQQPDDGGGHERPANPRVRTARWSR